MVKTKEKATTGNSCQMKENHKDSLTDLLERCLVAIIFIMFILQFITNYYGWCIL